MKTRLHDENGSLKGKFKVLFQTPIYLDTLKTKNESQESRITNLQDQIVEKIGVIAQLRKDLDEAKLEDMEKKANDQELDSQLQMAYDYIR